MMVIKVIMWVMIIMVTVIEIIMTTLTISIMQWMKPESTEEITLVFLLLSGQQCNNSDMTTTHFNVDLIWVLRSHVPLVHLKILHTGKWFQTPKIIWRASGSFKWWSDELSQKEKNIQFSPSEHTFFFLNDGSQHGSLINQRGYVYGET